LRNKSKSKRILNALSLPTTEIKWSPFQDLEIRFRIEEVSFHHADRGVFKLKCPFLPVQIQKLFIPLLVKKSLSSSQNRSAWRSIIKRRDTYWLQFGGCTGMVLKVQYKSGKGDRWSSMLQKRIAMDVQSCEGERWMK
jgi:hypothetical protein